jgi:hypothetical protein
LAFVENHAGSRRRLPPPSFPIGATSTSSTVARRRRLTQVVSLASSPLEATSTLISVEDVAASLQFFYTAALVAGVGYSQRMAGRQDFKKEMATKIATGKITPEELVDEIVLMAEEINNEISESKSFAEAAQMEVEKILEETRAIQQKLQQIPDALNIEKAALAIEVEVPVKAAPLQEKVLVTAGGKEIPVKEKVVTAGGNKEESTIPIGVMEGFGVYDDVFEMEAVEEEEKEWSVPVVGHDDEIKINVEADESEESTQDIDTTDKVEENDGIELVANDLPTNDTDRDERLSPSSVEESREAIRQQAEDFRARIKSMEARLSSDATTKQVEEKVTPDPKPSPPASEPPVEVLSSAINTIEQKRVVPDGPIRSSPLARLLCSELGVELADVYPGSGLKGRIIADDVRNYAKSRGNAAA